MDRKRAQSQIGKDVIVDEQSQGQYVGELLEVIAEPKKPWRGLIKIKAVASLPRQDFDTNDEFKVIKPIYSLGHIEEFPSTKIKDISIESFDNYQDSLVLAVTKEIETLQFSNERNTKIVHELIGYLEELNPTIADLYKEENIDENEENKYVYYSVKEVNGELMLLDSIQNQYLALNGCPFLFELYVNGNWEKGHFISGNTFQSLEGKKSKINTSKKLRMERDQFDPYHLLINELEKPALEALEKSLHSFALTHKDVLHCHNTLLIKLLHSNNEKKFNGVNFITYQNHKHTVIVQHHFERMLKEDTDDVYDRFEFTTDVGKRSIITYTNQFSKGH